MSEARLQVAIIIGSARAGQFGRTVANWLAAQVCRRCGVEVDVIDLARVWLPDAAPGDPDPKPLAVQDLARWLDAADAFVIVTPEHNQSFPGALKNVIDWYVHEWRAKPVGFVAYGGGACGLRAVEQLRQVFAGLEAVTVPETVSLRGEHEHPGAYDTAAQRMLDHLLWWAEALRGHRADHPDTT